MEELFTEKGKETLKNRLEGLCTLYGNDDQKYPFRFNVLGFTVLKVRNKTELLYRIKELSEILNVDVEISVNVKIIEEQNGN